MSVMLHASFRVNLVRCNCDDILYLVAAAGEKRLSVPRLSFSDSVDTPAHSRCSRSEDDDEESSSDDGSTDESSTDWEDEHVNKQPGE